MHALAQTADGRRHTRAANDDDYFGGPRTRTKYGYDEAGNMTCKADGRYATSGSTTCENVTNHWVYAHDALNRVTSIDYLETAGTVDVVFSYDTRAGAPDQKGRLRQVVNINGSITATRKMDYDAWGNVTWSEQTVANGATSKAYATSYQYDGNSQLKKITYPSGRVLDYTRHPNGQIKDVKATFNGVTTTVVALATYEPFVDVPNSIKYGNDILQTRTSKTDSSPLDISLMDGYGEVDGRSYTVNNTGGITQIQDHTTGLDTRNFSHDKLHRLTWDSKASATYPTYTYDGNGNRLTRAAGTYPAQSFTYSATSNRDVGTSYDGMGNALNDSATYNAAGRLNSVVESGYTLSLSYNGLGELARTALTQVDACSGAIVTLEMDDFVFAPDGRALYLRSMTGTGTVWAGTDYVWLDNLPVAQIQDSYDTQGALIGTEVTYLHADHLGTPRIGTNASRQVTWSNRSDAFGIPDLSFTAVVRLRFPGQLSLGVAGLNYNNYRDYKPDTGRYLESDPIGLDGGLNTYGYVDQNPLSLIDPEGLQARPPPPIRPPRSPDGRSRRIPTPGDYNFPNSPVRPPSNRQVSLAERAYRDSILRRYDLVSPLKNLDEALRGYVPPDIFVLQNPDKSTSRPWCSDDDYGRLEFRALR
jgi:RHS repeat-associated protein